MTNATEDLEDIDFLVDLLDDADNSNDIDYEPVPSCMSDIQKQISVSRCDGPNLLHNNNKIKSSCKSVTSSQINGQRSSSSTIDTIENELVQMEEKMEKLRAELVKKKNISPENENKIGFIKYSGLIQTPTETVRNLGAKETKELLQRFDCTKSELHSGETDSEDDEDNRNPYDQSLSTSGREMKKRLAYASNGDILSNRKDCRNKLPSDSEKSKTGWSEANGGSLLPMGSKKLEKPLEKEEKYITDPFSGIKLNNPLISSTGMQELMTGRKMIQISTITMHLRGGEIEGNWVTIGIIVSKSEPKKSQKGSQYIIWQLSDLRDCTKVVSLFLFAGAYKQLWKTTVGSAIGILNPSIMKERQSDQRNTMTLSVNNHQNILMMGSSKDLGWCKGRTKIGQCRQFVNKSVCEFCVYHIQREYQKSSSKRADIQSSFTSVDPRKAFQKKVLGKDQVFYGGQLYSSGPTERKSKPSQRLATASKCTKDLTTLSSLKIKLKAKDIQEEDKKQIYIGRPNHLTNHQLDTVKEVAKINEDLGQMLLAPTPGARNLLKHISKEPRETESSGTKIHELSAKELLAATKKEKILQKKVTLSNSPQLGRGFGPNKHFEFEVSPASLKKDAAKFRAANVLHQNGGLKVQDKNMKRNREKASSAQFQDSIKKRLKVSLDNEGSDANSSLTVNPDKSCEQSETVADPLLDLMKNKSLLGSIDINVDKFQSMMRAKSNHTSLVQAAEDEQVEKYYNSLEKKEMLENKLVSIMEIPTTAVVCLKCKYKAISAADHCREENHPLKLIKASKRFFECRNCKRRTATLDKFPGKSCVNCDQSSWKRVGMGKEKHGPKLENETLSLRGDELSHYSGTSNQIYLHL